MKTLIIDTSSNKEVTVGVEIDGIRSIKTQSLNTRKAQVILPLIETLLKEKQLTLKDLTTIEVNTGPGSFTGLRVGITVANTLGFLLKVPINGKKVGEIVEAVYV